jgi:hypothetical protein
MGHKRTLNWLGQQKVHEPAFIRLGYQNNEMQINTLPQYFTPPLVVLRAEKRDLPPVLQLRADSYYLPPTPI